MRRKSFGGIPLLMLSVGLVVLAPCFLGCGKKAVKSTDTIAPTTITDLATIDPTDSSIALTWATPGDDQHTGTAAQYDIRYAPFVITDLSWDSAMQVANPPSPRPAGFPDTFTVHGLDTYSPYSFAIKTADESNNWSPISNIASDSTTYHIWVEEFPLRVGTRWVYALYDSIWHSADTLEVSIVDMGTLRNGTAALIWEHKYTMGNIHHFTQFSWGDTSLVVISGDTVTFYEPKYEGQMELLVFPLAPGFSWRSGLEVSAPEDVYTPAGFYSKTLRVDFEYQLPNEKYSSKCWIAPDVGMVKGSLYYILTVAPGWNHRSTLELISYDIPSPRL